MKSCSYLVRIMGSILLVSLLVKPVFASSANQGNYIIEDTTSFQRLAEPKIALALGGGGARALVNIGVLKALEEEEIPVDMVVGTSMGAIVAVMYGSGMPVAQMEKLVTSVSLPKYFDLNPHFTESLLTSAELNYFLESILPHQRLENFPIPTALLSFDLVEGKKYVHTTGAVSQVVQGAYAIPFCFPGLELEEHYLVDAGIQELTPAQTAKILGADLVIAITAYDSLPYDLYDSSLRSFMRLINLIKEDYSMGLVEDYSDVVIEHDVGDYSFMDFHLAQKFIDLGYGRAKKMIPEIKGIMAEQGIELKSPAHKEPVNLRKIIRDSQNDREILEHFLIKPRVFLGQNQSYFRQDLFRDSLHRFQYGAEFKGGQVRVSALAGVEEETQGKIRLVQLRKSLDLTALLSVGDEEGSKWDLSLNYFCEGGRFDFGLTGVSDARYLHLKGIHDWTGERWRGTTEADLFLSIGAKKPATYTISQSWKMSLKKGWAFEPDLVVSSGVVFESPRIYRGAEVGVSPDWQLGLNLVHNRVFDYSLEVAQIIQVKGLDSRVFMDILQDQSTSTAAGVGVGIDLSLLGLKPSRLEGFLARDFQKDSINLGVKYNLYL